MCCPLRSILACVRNLCYRVGKDKYLKVNCLSCERKSSSEWLKKNVGDFSKNVGRFSRNVGVFLDASEMNTAALANFFQRAELFTVKKAFNNILRACVRAHTTAILHFLLSQPSQISV